MTERALDLWLARKSLQTPSRRGLPPIHAKLPLYSSSMRKQRLVPPISVPTLKARSPAHDGGRLRMKTPPRARTAALGEQRKRARNLAGARSLSPASSRCWGGEQWFSLAFRNGQDDADSGPSRSAMERGGSPPAPPLAARDIGCPSPSWPSRRGRPTVDTHDVFIAEPDLALRVRGCPGLDHA